MSQTTNHPSMWLTLWKHRTNINGIFVTSSTEWPFNHACLLDYAKKILIESKLIYIIRLHIGVVNSSHIKKVVGSNLIWAFTVYRMSILISSHNTKKMHVCFTEWLWMFVNVSVYLRGDGLVTCLGCTLPLSRAAGICFRALRLWTGHSQIADGWMDRPEHTILKSSTQKKGK